MATPNTVARVGISGWRYAPWRGVFYPENLPQRRELEYAAGHLDTLEINGTFYSLQRPASYRDWHDTAPGHFVFAVKGGKFVTHVRMLHDVRIPLANFFASGVLTLDDKLGPMLWQLPPWYHYDPETMEEFLGLLPRTADEARTLSAEHSDFLDEDHVATGTSGNFPLRHAVEVRHESFATPRFYEQLARHNTALVVADTAGTWPELREITADFVYARLHGHGQLYAGGYPDPVLDEWAATVRGWLTGDGCPDGQGRDAFIYFDNDTKIRAPHDAMALAERLGRGPAPA
jgi:uncharacterized protein YecE (DUF72 family)